MKKLILLLAFIAILTNTDAQLKTYLTFEAGPQWSLLRVADPGDVFQRANVKSTMAGFTIGQEIIPNLSIVTGAYYVPNRNGINMIDNRPHQSRWSSYTSLLIPLRAEYRIQPTEYPFSFTPRLGYVYGLVSLPESPFLASGVLSAPDGTAYGYDLAESYSSQNLHMLEIGIGLNLRIYGFWQASLNLSYMTGFTDPMSTSLDYSTQGNPETSATYTTKGNSIQTTLAFNIPVSNIWQNKDYRVRARIENSVYKGKSTSRKGQFYLGAEIGSLWRQFDATNPAIGARPMQGRGLFKYANMHTGAYFGYMFTDEVGIDVGALYQQSSMFYAIMYDHEVDFVIKVPAPLYVELPLRIRYLYDVYKNKVHVGIYGGVSLLTQFSSGIYAQGTGSFSYHDPATGTPVDATTSYDATRLSILSPLMRLGAGVEYALPMEFPLILTLYVNYMNGFLSAERIAVTNSVPEAPSASGITYNGSGWSVDIGLKFPFRFGEKGNCGTLPERQ